METKRVASICIAALTLILLITYFVVPVFGGLTQSDTIRLEPGDEWTYEVVTNLPSTVTVEGADWLTVDGHTVHGTVPEDGGTWTVRVVAESSRPYQQAVQTIDLTTGTGTMKDKVFSLVWILPMLMALGGCVLVIRSFSTEGTGFGREPRERKERGQRSNIKIRRGRDR